MRNCSGSVCGDVAVANPVITLHPKVTASPEPTFRTEMAR